MSEIRFKVRFRARLRFRGRVRVKPYPNPNLPEESHSNQSEARIPDLSYEKKHRPPGRSDHTEEHNLHRLN